MCLPLSCSPGKETCQHTRSALGSVEDGASPRRGSWEALGLLVAVSLALQQLAGCAIPAPPEPAGEPSARVAGAISTANGLAFNGLGANGIAANGINLNGLTANGVDGNGISLNGGSLNGVDGNGISLNGIFLNGIPLNGIFLNGIFLNGVFLNGLVVDGVHLNGISLGGKDGDGISLEDVSLNGVAIDGTTAEQVKVAMGFLVGCALPEDQCVDLHDLDGSSLTLCGAAGLDPGWATGVPDLSKSQVVGQCVMERAAAAGYSVEHQPVVVENFKKVFRYMVECALPPGHEVKVVDVDGVTVIGMSGALGLAPEWESGPPTRRGQRYVSACLAARTNANGETVQISLRGGGIAMGAAEAYQYRRHEGGFMGDLFAPTPYVKTCQVDGGEMAGRTCTEGTDCGFTPLGSCAAHCSAKDESGAYTRCDGDWTVLNTFLPFESVVSSADYNATCTVRPDHSLWCWGSDEVGQLADGTPDLATVLTPQQPLIAPGQPLTNVAAVSSLPGDVCARRQTGDVWCWGVGGGGLLGNGSTQDSAWATQTLAGFDNVDVNGSQTASCVVKANGTVACWGDNTYGQLGDGTQTPRLEPTPVIDGDGGHLSGVVKVAASYYHSCALRNDGSLFCWGFNSAGQLGVSSLGVVPTPVRVPLGEAVDVCGQTMQHTCALLADGSVWCWGYNRSGQLGNGETSTKGTSEPAKVVGLPGPGVSLSCGWAHSCASLADKTVWCWGDGLHGELGTAPSSLEDQRFSTVPLQIPGITSAEVVMSGTFTVYALKTDGTLWAWGDNRTGQLGIGTLDIGTHATPVRMTSFPCGDGACAGGETPINCSADCPAVCGDGACTIGESRWTCKKDCGSHYWSWGF